MESLDRESSANHHENCNMFSGKLYTKRIASVIPIVGHMPPNNVPFHLQTEINNLKIFIFKITIQLEWATVVSKTYRL